MHWLALMLFGQELDQGDKHDKLLRLLQAPCFYDINQVWELRKMTDKEAMKLALDALEQTLETLDNENSKPGGAIADTIWHSEHETLFDYLTSTIDVFKERLAQPEQEPVCDKDPQGCWNVRCQLGKKCKNTPPQRTEQNFCPRCGKRTPDLITIHTCTPPKD
jgi:hypothetical protein